MGVELYIFPADPIETGVFEAVRTQVENQIVLQWPTYPIRLLLHH